MLCCLQPYSVPRMQRLVAVALGMCNTVYITIIVCSSLVFGEALEADVLANVNSAAMAPLIGPAAAVAMAACVRVGYLLSLVGSYVLLCYPLRQVRNVKLHFSAWSTVHRTSAQQCMATWLSLASSPGQELLRNQDSLVPYTPIRPALLIQPQQHIGAHTCCRLLPLPLSRVAACSAWQTSSCLVARQLFRSTGCL
jgi:hypothetical protein